MTVYFAQQQTDEGLLKIGFSSTAEARVSTLQTASTVPIKLVATIDGGRETERYIHNLLKTSRHFGEWYKPTSEVLEFIQNVKTAKFESSSCVSKKKVSGESEAAREDLRIATELLGVAMGPISGRKTIGAALEELLVELLEINGSWTLRRLKSIQGQETTSINLWIIRDLSEVIERRRIQVGGMDRPGNHGEVK